MRHFARSHRCVTYSQRGYPPSDVPEDPGKYRRTCSATTSSPSWMRSDRQGTYRRAFHGCLDGAPRRHPLSAALHLGDGGGLRLRLDADPKVVEKSRAASHENAKMFAENTMADAAAKYGDGPTRQAHKNKDPRGYAHFIKMLSEHSPLGHSLTMANLQAKRPTLWEMQADLKKFSLPLLIVVGDEDDWCLDASVFLRRTVPTAGLVVVPRTGHTLTSEESEKFNGALAEFFAESGRGTWLSHKPRK